jgi:hypothetical protein
VSATNVVTVVEGRSATFQVKLSARPAGSVEVAASRISGDADITLGGGATLTFTPADWNSYKSVTLNAAEDPDLFSGTATIRFSAPGLVDTDVTAAESDNDTGRPVFTDVPLAVRNTPIKTAHISELRDAIAALRSRYGLSTVRWTDDVLTAHITAAKAVHLEELRAALAAVYGAAGRASPTYATQVAIAGQTVVTATDLAELRTAVMAIW